MLRRQASWLNRYGGAGSPARVSSSLLLLVRLMAVPTSTWAAPSKDEQAHAAYDEAAAAYDTKDFATAAADFALADELLPNPAVLKLALVAAVRAELPELAMNLVLRAEARGESARMLELIRLSREQFASRVGYLRVSCVPLHVCTVTVAGHAAIVGAEQAYAPGTLEVTFSGEGGVSSSSILVTTGRLVELHEPEAPRPKTVAASGAPISPPEAPAPPLLVNHPGLPREVFWGGVALSTALAAATFVSAADTVHTRHAFLDNRTEQTRDRAQASVARSNVLLAATLASTLASALVGLLYTSWNGGAGTRASFRFPPAAVVVF